MASKTAPSSITVIVRDPTGTVWAATPSDIVGATDDGTSAVVVTGTGLRLAVPPVDAWVQNRIYDGKVLSGEGQ